MQKAKTYIYLAVFVLLVAGGVFGYFYYQKSNKNSAGVTDNSQTSDIDPQTGADPNGVIRVVDESEFDQKYTGKVICIPVSNTANGDCRVGLETTSGTKYFLIVNQENKDTLKFSEYLHQEGQIVVIGQIISDTGEEYPSILAAGVE